MVIRSFWTGGFAVGITRPGAYWLVFLGFVGVLLDFRVWPPLDGFLSREGEA